VNTFNAELQGGLGNQLFILGAGMSAAERFGLPLVLDARSLSSPGERPLAIEPLIAELSTGVSLVKGQKKDLASIRESILYHPNKLCLDSFNHRYISPRRSPSSSSPA
jgi:hypothetical protein